MLVVFLLGFEFLLMFGDDDVSCFVVHVLCDFNRVHHIWLFSTVPQWHSASHLAAKVFSSTEAASNREMNELELSQRYKKKTIMRRQRRM